MKPFATLGSEISKVREKVRRGAEALRPTKVANDVRDQRDRLLAKLGEQTFRLIAERKLQVPKVLQDSVEKLAALLGVQLPPPPSDPNAAQVAATETEAVAAVASDPIDEPAEIDEPSVGDMASTPSEVTAAAPSAPEIPAKAAPSARPAARPKKRGGKRRNRR